MKRMRWDQVRHTVAAFRFTDSMMKSAIPIAEMRQGTTATIVSLGPLQGARVRRAEGNEWVQLTANALIKADDFHTWTREQLPTFKVLPN